MQSKAFLLYPSQWSALKELTTLELGELMTALFLTLTEVKFDEKKLSDRVLLAYRFMMLQIGIDIEKYDRRLQKSIDKKTEKEAQQKLTNDLQKLRNVKSVTFLDKEKEEDKERENEKENEKEKEKENSCKAAEGSGLAKYDYYIKAFNEVVKNCKIPPIRKITDERAKKLRWLHDNYKKEDIWLAYKKAACSAFLNGQGVKHKFQATFDWLIEPTNFIKVLEGNFN